MKPGTSFWLRIIVATSLAVAISASPISRAHADRLPVKEVKRPILKGEPEDPDGTIPTGGLSAYSSTFRNPTKPVVKGEPQDPDKARLNRGGLKHVHWLLFTSRLLRP
jgi:hypothetical protein